MIRVCWKCDRQMGEMPVKVGFRAQCPHCGVDLHCCVACRYYAPGKPNDCAVPGTEPVKDREAMNFCEEFAPKPPGTQQKPDDEAKKRARKILGLDS